MTERYGHKWTAAHGECWDTVEQPWLNDLHDLTPAEFATGVRTDLARDGNWPPGSKEFRHMAIKDRRSEEPAHQLVPKERLLPNEPDSDAAQRWIAYCIGVVGMQPLRKTMTIEQAHETLEDVNVRAMTDQVTELKANMRSKHRAPNPMLDDMRTGDGMDFAPRS